MSTKKSTRMSDKTIATLEKITKKKLTVGNLLWSIREGEEMTLVEFSKLLGISRQYLCDLEHGRRTASPKMADAFAQKLGYSSVQFVRLALQEELEKAGLHFNIQVEAA
jgi:transcriptional regulator with XRE-family HTH domain